MGLEPLIPRQHKRLLLMAWGLIGFMAIVGILFNVKTVPVNDDIRKTKQKISIVHDDNERKKLELAKILTLRAVETRAASDLGMSYPDQVRYIDQSGHELDKDGNIIEKDAPESGQ